MKFTPLRERLAVFRRQLLAIALASFFPGTVLADAVTDWNTNANDVIGGAGAPPQQFRVFAIVQIAVHDALNAIDPRYEPYSVVGAGNPNASPEAAVARAARDTLVALLPDAQDAIIDARYAIYIAGLSCPVAQPSCITDGESIGAEAAQAILEDRTLDGSENPHLPYTLAPGIGVYQPTLPTPPAPQPFPQFGGWGEVKPFVLGNAAQFSPGNTDFLRVSGKAYTDDYNEVKSVGSALVRSAAPDSEESRIARYWPGGGGNLNGVARVIVDGRGLDMWEHARLFALMNIAVNDTLIATFKAKYKHNFWRPYTAIRWADDGNPDTESDPEWTSYITTPPYPDYTCGLPSTVGAGTEVIRDFFGTDEVAYTFTVPGIPPRSYTTLSQAADEAAMARVYGGIHFRTGCVSAVRFGEQVGRFVFNTRLRPLH